MNKSYFKYVVFLSTIICAIYLFFFAPKTSIYDYIKNKRLERHHYQQFEKHKIVCSQCKGTGECPTDVNKLMMDAGLALFINHHLNVDKCEKCVKLRYGDGYEYCETVESKYQTLLKEYGAAGPKISMAACSECMGMGQFTSQNPDGSYMTQTEYDAKHKK